jgi:hypothetical protein
MSKIIPLLTLAVGGAAAFVSLRRGAASEKLGEELHGVAGKVRDTFAASTSGNSATYDAANEAIVKASESTKHLADRVEQGIDSAT